MKRRYQTIDHLLEPGGPVAVIAHRGFSGRYPENTTLAFERALELEVSGYGVDMIELDVTLTSDGQPFVLHDETLDRTTTGSGRALDLPWESLRSLDAGAWAGYAGEPLPTLEDAVIQITERALLNIEIKGEAFKSHQNQPEPTPMGQAVTSLIAERRLYDRVVVSSFEPRALCEIARLDEAVRLAVLCPTLSSQTWNQKTLRRQLERATGPHQPERSSRPRGLNLRRDRVSPATVKAAHALGCALSCYTVNDQPDMLRLMEYGVDGLFTDHPDRLLALREGALA